MRKLVFKTVLTTLAIIVLVVALVVGSLALFAPKVLANFDADLGIKNWATDLYERQCEISGDEEDIYKFISYADLDENAASVEKYAQKLAESDNFNSFCLKKDQSEGTNGKISTAEYVYSKLVRAIYINSGIDKAVEKATSIVTANNAYTEYGPFSALILSGKVKTEVELEKIEVALNAFDSAYASNSYYIQDKNDLQSLINSVKGE